MERIDKAISTLMCISRSDARRLIKIGKVYINETKVKAFDTKIDENTEINVNGKKLLFCKNIYIMMNKRSGVVCDDKSDAPYAPDELNEELKRKDLFCVGRLDKDTTGLLIITNDGDFAHKAITPKKNIVKTYRTVLAEPLNDQDIQLAEKGIVLKDGTKLLPAQIKILSEDRKTADFLICEGKYHQIKRMAGAMNNYVTGLHRIKIGALELDTSLKFGEAKIISKETAFKVFE